MTTDTAVPRRAMVLAAGLGQRMRPLTDNKPKPLLEVAGKPLIDHLLDRLAAAGVAECVVNLHYLAPMMRRHLAERQTPRIELSPEETLLDSGGGVAKALPRLGDAPFLVTNADMLWLDGPRPMLHRLAALWRPEEMDALLLLHPTVAAHGYDGAGDYFLAPDGTARRRRGERVAPFVFTGVQILSPRLFRDLPEGPFSLRLLYDRAEEAGRLYAMRHDGEWFHVGTPEALSATETYFAGPRRLARTA